MIQRLEGDSGTTGGICSRRPVSFQNAVAFLLAHWRRVLIVFPCPLDSCPGWCHSQDQVGITTRDAVVLPVILDKMLNQLQHGR